VALLESGRADPTLDGWNWALEWAATNQHPAVAEALLKDPRVQGAPIAETEVDFLRQHRLIP